MKHILSLLLLVIFCDTVICQQNFNKHIKARYYQPNPNNESISDLNDNRIQADQNRIKSDTGFIKTGGEFRQQYFFVKNEQWGDENEDKDGYLLTRMLYDADINFNKSIRTFLQLQSSLANGKISPPSPIDQNLLDLHQAFIDVRLSSNKKTNTLIRLGRQEFFLGSGRLVAVRDGPNNRQSFDGINFSLNNRLINSQVFYSTYVVSKPGILDDKLFSNDIHLWGSYSTFKNLALLDNVDIYYLGIKRSKSIYDDYKGREVRHSIGTRIWKNSDSWKYDFEAVYQFGKAGLNSIDAYTISSNTSYRFSNLILKPMFTLKTEVVSGDLKKDDLKLNTFNALFPKGNYFGWAALIGPANLFDIHPSIELELSKSLRLNFDHDIFWRLSTEDGVYSPNTAMLYPSGIAKEKAIGSQFSIDLNYSPHTKVYFRPELTYFKTGEYLKEVSLGKDIFLLALTMQLKLR